MTSSTLNVTLHFAEMTDLPAIKEIITDARGFLADQGIDQWQNGYPEDAVIAADIDRGETVALKDDEGTILAIASLVKGIDDAYEGIVDGKWRVPATPTNYVSIHRVAMAKASRGHHLTHDFFDLMLEQIRQDSDVESVRIDTHPENFGMQHVIETNGFDYIGLVPVVGGRPDETNVAYDMVLN
ncbi:GNAT family N-acetyltransferase [Furfurilactobacillus entadae]|uniref:GNAT family N-acetyltransferase n=1 Tax=Furfurilactobacillus entadae TaxID=2922307 RepID=UPI0035E7E114